MNGKNFEFTNQLEPQTRKLEVYQDELTGGVRIVFGRDEIVLSPDDAVGMSNALLTAVGRRLVV